MSLFDATTRSGPVLDPSARHFASRTGTGQAFGTFGELLQGVTTSNLDFLVTLPIDRGSTARFTHITDTDTITVLPDHKRKARLLARLMLDAHGRTGGGVLEVDSDLPEGKGFASSSADLVATARAVAQALGVPVPPTTIESFLRRIEPTDGVMYPGAVAFYHREVRLREFLGPLPPLSIIAVEEGGVVDTIEFNRRPKTFTHAERVEYDRLLEEASEAVKTGEAAPIGRVATRSALLNERLRPKRLLEPMIRIARECDALGVAIAHSGTTVGVLITGADPEHRHKINAVTSLTEALAGSAAHFRTPPSWARPPMPVTADGTPDQRNQGAI